MNIKMRNNAFIITSLIAFSLFLFICCKKDIKANPTDTKAENKVGRFRVDTTTYSYIVSSTTTPESVANDITGYWIVDSLVSYLSDSITEIDKYGQNRTLITNNNTFSPNEEKDLSANVVDTTNTNIVSKLRISHGLIFQNHISVNDTIRPSRPVDQWKINVFGTDGAYLRSSGNIAGLIMTLKNNKLIFGNYGKIKNGIWSFCHKKN